MRRYLFTVAGRIGASVLLAWLVATIVTAAQDGARPSGIYVVLASASSGAPVRLEPAAPMMGTAEGGWKSAFTGGFSKPATVLTIANAKSPHRVADPRATFEFVFPAKTGPSTPGDIADMAEMIDESRNGLLRMTSHPKQYVLAQLETKDETRVLRAGKSPVATVDSEAAGPKVFRVRPREPLPPGEYGIYQKDAPGRIWDFGIDPQ